MGRPKSSSRILIEDCQFFSVQQLPKCDPETLNLSQTCNECGHTVPLRFVFVKTRQGIRVLCPKCGRRVEKLYRLPRARFADWACKGCHGLVYASQYQKRKATSIPDSFSRFPMRF